MAWSAGRLAGHFSWAFGRSLPNRAITCSAVASNTSEHKAWVGSDIVLPMKKDFGAAPALRRAYSEEPSTAG